ncbi:hypothetical protein [Burkholderia cepacia]|uniref:hypothetical protein n=1 Tax=Burkholderia cepacia TaxID=292 RepID=UPI001CF33C58|nr:hypothetical protein [Burkholderia cepacia]MCA8026413.1 hypothetical protein [Burkholderia cepacia]
MMRRPAAAPIRRNQIARAAVVPAPVGGWNARDPLAAMAPEDAVILNNWFPQPGGVQLRNGSANWATGLGNQVNSLMSYNPATGTPKLFAAAGGAVYDVTAPGAVGAPAISSLSSDKWSHTNFATPAGPFLVMVNGVDTGQIYDGTTWHPVRSATVQTISSITSVGTTATLTTAQAHGLTTGDQVTISGATPSQYNGTYTITVTSPTTFTYVMASAPGGSATVVGTYAILWNITGVDPTSLNFVIPFASRIWFIQKQSLNAYYLPPLSVGGAASAFPMQQLFRRGGYLVAAGIWTVDGGYGMQDYLCFVTSEGEIAVYGGTDPSQSSTFSLVGVYQVGTPMGNRCFLKYGGDLLYIGKDGLGPISRLLASSRVNTQQEFTYKIQGAISQATALYATNFGWQMLLHPIQNQLYLNVPVSTGQQQQFVMNTITGAWCNFSGWPANCWERFQDQIFYGGNGVVVQAWANNLDDNGVAIQGEALQAFQNFGSPQMKQFTMVRPILESTGQPQIQIKLNVDFDVGAPEGVPTFPFPSVGVWDVSLWDRALWAPTGLTFSAWENASGIGTWGAMHIVSNALDETLEWTATSYLMQDAGVL